MARLTITHTHDLTPTDLRKLEKQQDNVCLRMCITAVRLVMEDYIGKEVADLCNLHRQSFATYVKKFNEGGIDALLERKCGPGRPCFFYSRTTKRTQASHFKRVPLPITDWDALPHGPLLLFGSMCTTRMGSR